MSADPNCPIVVVGMACRVPGADNVNEFADLLYGGRTGYRELPVDRCDRSLYFDPLKGKVGKSYTTLGGTVTERPLNHELCPLSSDTERLFDVTHRQFAEVAATAWQNAELIPQETRLKRTGVYVGHSGGTKSGGGLSLGTQIEEALSFVDDIDAFAQLPKAVQRDIIAEVAVAIRHDRPSRKPGALPKFHAYQAAALSAGILGLTGPRVVIDAACASSLVALAQAILAIRAGRIDSALVGGATYNNIDNLILFSHSQACTATDSRPFDDHASGLVSSEGYVAIVVMTQELALQHDLPILGVIRGIGMASDGKGRSLWAPRMEGQVLALQRAYSDAGLLDIDYLETHATSTQLGDATELETLRTLASQSPIFSTVREPQDRLLLGSVKSNIGHTLEAAGLIGLVKVLLAMQRRQIPPSLRFEHPNRNYDWTTAPVRVVSRTESWPEQALSRRSRRAAVSAFGIGGLNAHLVVEEAGRTSSEIERSVDASSRATHGLPLSTEPIAIVGRGIVVAGALNLTEFKSVLESTRSMLSDAPQQRWRNRAGVSAGQSATTHRSPHCHGGFITNFVFDGGCYAIPPKQVQQANPVQLMLIDAVAQALRDVNGIASEDSGTEERKSPARRKPELPWPVHRQRVGVVIGAIFGGEFGDQLQVGMRLPEICGQITTAMERHGIASRVAQQTADQFRQTVLKNRPALLDETGSFTASTLASRIAKTFDLMGGACALDTDDTSGLSALATAADQLRSGSCDMVVCGSAQRSMSLAAFEALDLNGQLVRSGRAEDVPDDCRQILPGEGVATLILCRLSDAKRLDLPIHGILGDVSQCLEVSEDPVDAAPESRMAMDGSATMLTLADAEIVRKIGYLGGAHSLVRITAETLRTSSLDAIESKEPIAIAARTSDGVIVKTSLSIPGREAVVPTWIDPQPPTKHNTPLSKQISTAMTNLATAPNDRLRSLRIAATSGDSLLKLLRDLMSRPAQLPADQCVIREQQLSSRSPFQFNCEDHFRAMILTSSADQLQKRLAVAIKAAEAGNFSTLFDKERVILWQTKEPGPRVAWLFPGQGSHYPETPAVQMESEVARQVLAEVDELYAASRLPRLSTAFDNQAIKPGADVWWAQAWVLGVSASLISALKANGLRPDAVLGHSFGEFTASLAAKVTTLPQLIELAKHRANAVMSHMRTPGGLLSVRAAVHEVDSILKSAGLAVYVTHLNSTKQTVIAGSREGIAAAKTLLDRHGLASMSISVPAPFHTPLLAEAEVAFGRMSASVPMRSPTCGFLSATSVQYLAEPSEIRNSLVRQLTQPVMYMPSIQRMLGEGFRVLLEVGPNDVLTRMNRDIVDSQALCLSLDVPGQTFAERLQLVQAVLECAANVSGVALDNSSVNPRAGLGVEQPSHSSVPVRPSESVFDVTRSSRGARKALPASDSSLQERQQSADPVAERPPAVAASSAQQLTSVPSTGISDSQLRSFVLDLVIELTGYEPDVVAFDADLEAHLGIDSIKKAQILGEMGVWLGLTVRPDGLRFDSVHTLDDAIHLVRQLAQSEAESRPSDSRADASPAREVQEEPSEEFHDVSARHMPAESRAQAAARGILPQNDQLDDLLIEYVVDQTGYDRSVVDLDADLEADLGLDSIKLAQLIGQMREQFGLESLTLESIGQRRFPSLRSIREFLVQHAAADSANDPEDSPLSAVPPVLETLPGGVRELTCTIASDTRTAAIPDSAVRGTDPVSDETSAWSEWYSANRDFAHAEAAVHAGLQQGQQHQTQIRTALRSLVNQSVGVVGQREWNVTESAHLKGLAAGAGVAESSVRFAAAVVQERLRSTQERPTETHVKMAAQSAAPSDTQGARLNAAAPQQTQRFALRVVAAPRRAGMPTDPVLHRAALILGNNAVAESLAARIRQLGHAAIVLSTSLPVAQLESKLQELWRDSATPHLFLTMAFDAEATKNLTQADWKSRRPAALEAPFRICQLWMQKTIEANQMENASVVALTQLGGDYGFSGQRVHSIEAIGGLVKAMLIEAWMRGFRTTPMKVIDIASDMTPDLSAKGALQELAVPSYDMEIAFRRGNGTFSTTVNTRTNAESAAEEPARFCVQAVPAPLSGTQNSSHIDSPSRMEPATRITRGGTWIVSGGGRGITAVIAMTLAKKYSLKLHLLGTAPVPQLSDEFVQRVAQDRSGVRNGIMQEASSRKESPVEAWRNTEKALEIHATLRECREAGIMATYHCCDVSNFANVERTLGLIRKQAGSICGVIHGAGAGQDARFDRKRPDKVEKCLRAKIDGSIALMQATNQDPLEWFVAFGSISGRFGANGHTDYSLANDMMAKIVDRYRSQRPEVRSLTFHWHAWGDIGMATKPEAKLALEMIDMEFMPARDGIAHFMRELEFGGDEPEVLITDESYFRKFFPAERLSLNSTTSGQQSLPLLPLQVVKHQDGVCSSVLTLNPVSDRFLSQHRVKGRPTLPFVVALELMAEAVRARTGQPFAGICLQARALHPIRFASDDPLAVTVQTRPAENGTIECRLLADVRRRDGRMVAEDREFFRAVFDPREQRTKNSAEAFQCSRNDVLLQWKRIEYGLPEGLIYHGPELQELREVADNGQTIFGRIAASAPVQLFGGSRATGFTLPCSTMDACLYAVGYAAWFRHQKPSLPVSFDKIEFGRLPDPGEPCLVRIQEAQILPSGVSWNFQLQGHNGDRLLTVSGYQIGWLKIG